MASQEKNVVTSLIKKKTSGNLLWLFYSLEKDPFIALHISMVGNSALAVLF